MNDKIRLQVPSGSAMLSGKVVGCSMCVRVHKRVVYYTVCFTYIVLDPTAVVVRVRYSWKKERRSAHLTVRAISIVTAIHTAIPTGLTAIIMRSRNN